jgi:protein gp37
MGEVTAISWTDHTFNPWWGCTRVSPGCVNCYAETFDKRTGGDHWGPGKPRRTFSDKHWNEPIKWDAKAAKAGVQRKVFCASMADIMDVEAPEGQRERLWDLIERTPNLIWQLLTKRPENYEKFLPSAMLSNPRVWLGVTAEDQKHYEERWPILWALSPEVSWISYEPALGPLRLKTGQVVPDWIICGGESGNGFRPMEERWANVLLAQCQERDVKFFMKQMSARTPAEGKRLIPDHLQIQEFPVL